MIPADRLEEIVERTRKAGAEIVGLLKTGSAFYAPASSVLAMVGAILRDEKRILPTCTYLDGEYGLRGLCLGVPAKLGEKGVEEILQLRLKPDELEALRRCAQKVAVSFKALEGQF